MLQTITKWFSPPQFPDDEDKTRSALLLNVVLNTFLIALPVLILGAILGGNTPRLERSITVLTISWLTIFGTRLLMLAGQVTAAGTAMVGILYIATTLVVYNNGTIRAPATSFYILAIVMAGLIINRRAIIWLTGLSSITIIVLLIGERNNRLPAPNLTVTVTQGVSFTVAFAIIAILLFLATKSIDEALARVRQELIERQRAETKLRASEKRLEILHEIDRALISARSPREIAQAALGRIRQLIPSARASATLFDFSTETASFLAVDSDGNDTADSTPMSLDQYGLNIIAMLRENKPWFTEDMLIESDATELDKRLAHERGIRTWLALPLLYQGQLIGALNLARHSGQPFNAPDAETAQDVANQLAIAIQQTHLLEALQNELTERKHLIEQLEANNAELERFTYTVSHDLRNPLVTIKGFLGMLDKDMRENRPDRVQTDFQRIAGATEKMDALLTDLLELSRIGRIVNPPMEVDTVRLIQDALDNLDGRLRPKNITLQIAPEFPSLYGDRTRLREVFENLLENAAKYIGTQPDPFIEIGTRRDKNGQVIFVKDNGIGIEERYHTRIFALFEKLNPGIDGTGIGLALVKRIVEVHGGKIWVESEGLGKGSTFCFTIPDNRRQL